MKKAPTADGFDGTNNPPPDPLDIRKRAIEDLHGEAKLWLDGAKIESQEVADGIGNLIILLRKQRDGADEDRKTEKEPYLNASREVDARWKIPINLAEQAIEACKKALLPWQQAERDRIERERIAALNKAREADEAAQKAMRESDQGNLGEMEAVGALMAASIEARADVSAAFAAKPVAGSQALGGRRVGLRQKAVPKIIDRKACMTHYWSTHREDVVAFLLQLAAEDVKNKILTIPGVEITYQDSVA